MPSATGNTVIAAGVGVVVENVLAGTQYERVPGQFMHALKVFAVGSNGAAGDTSMEVTLGQRVLLPNGALGFRAAGVEVDSDEVTGGVGSPGDLIKLRITNNNAAARNVAWRISLQPVA